MLYYATATLGVGGMQGLPDHPAHVIFAQDRRVKLVAH
jgi:hypothetical protein